MKIKINGGKVIHPALSFAFSMQELGGSWIQKYNTLLGTFNPDRNLTPYQLKPQLIIDDPEGNIPTGDYASAMTNVVWTLRLYRGSKAETLTAGQGKDYYVDSLKSLTIYRNLETEELLSVDFRGDYYNATRKETSHFTWHKDLTTADETEANITLELRFPSKMNFYPFKNYGKFPIEAVLLNGSSPMDATKCTFKWQVFDYTTKTWMDIMPDDNLWYVSGKDSGTIIVDVDFIQHTALRVTGYPKADSTLQDSASTLLRRWYGQWDDDYGFAYAQFLQSTTRRAKAIAKVTNRNGDITNPQQYFDIQMFYRDDENSPWKSLGNGTEFEVEREHLTEDHLVGGCCRELSAYKPIALPDGKILCDNTGKPMVGRFPTSEIEYE